MDRMPVYRMVVMSFQFLRVARMGSAARGLASRACVSGTWVAAVSPKLMAAMVVMEVAMRGRLEPSGSFVAYISVLNICAGREGNLMCCGEVIGGCTCQRGACKR